MSAHSTARSQRTPPTILEEDARFYVNKIVDDLLLGKSAELRIELVVRTTERYAGMFLWIKILKRSRCKS